MKRVMILTDIEGVSGVEGAASPEVGNSVFCDPRMAGYLVDEVNACIDGLRDGGADSILVWDCHGGGRNFSANQLRPGVRMCMINDANSHMSSLDAGFCATVQIGCHSKQGCIDGYLNHTRNSHSAALTAFNGIPIGEPEFGILRASFFHVPTLLVAGDYAACRDAREFNRGALETVVCKRAFSRYSVMHYPHSRVLPEIREKAAKAMRNIAAYRPLELNGDFEITYRAMCPNQVRDFIMKGCEMLDDVTVRLRGSDALDLYAQLSGWSPGVHNRHFGITSTTDDLYFSNPLNRKEE